MEFPLTLGLQKTGLPLIATSGKPKNFRNSGKLLLVPYTKDFGIITRF